MGNHSKNPNYEKDSQHTAENLESFYDDCVAGARKIVYSNAEKSAQNLANLLTSDFSPDQVPVLKLKSDTAKHLLKLAGMEIEQHQHSGSVSFQPLNISREDE